MPQPPPPAIVLVRPQLGENIGTAARAMLNCGLLDLRLVSPRDGWPSSAAYAACSGADRVLDQARLFDSAAEAVADVNSVYATTARPRDMVKPVLTPEAVADELRSSSETAAILFGPERTGLTNDEVVLARAIVSVPLNPDFSSLNLAQAVLLVAWSWHRLEVDVAPRREVDRNRQRAPAGEVENFLLHLEEALDRSGFLRVAEKRPIMMRNLRNIFQRADLVDYEVRTLHGVVTALTGLRRGELRDG